MAKQFSATVQGQSVSFPSSLVRIIGLSSGASIEYLGANYIADEAVADLISAANTDGTEQVSATVLRVNDAVQTFPITMGFPASLISIYPSTLSGSLSVIIYNNVFYYVEESKTAIEDAANTSSAGGVTIYTGDGSLSGDRTIDLNGHDFYIAQNGDNLFGVDLDGAGSWLYSHFTPNGQGLNEGAFSTRAVEGGVDALFDASFNGGAKEARIAAHAEETFSELNYLADTHTFNVGITITELAGVGTRAIAVDANGKVVLL